MRIDLSEIFDCRERANKEDGIYLFECGHWKYVIRMNKAEIEQNYEIGTIEEYCDSCKKNRKCLTIDDWRYLTGDWKGIWK